MEKLDELGERERQVLRAVVQEYVASGDPVGSSQLVKRSEFDVSPATMRNVLADLEALGLIEKPHTSAGRIPTVRGYRFFVDTFVRIRDPRPHEREIIEQGMSADAAVETALQEASRVLHFVTQHAGVVLTPRPHDVFFQQIEFVKLRENRVLAVMIGQNGEVHNKLLTADFPVSPDELVRMGNYLNELLAKVPLEEVRKHIQKEMDQERAIYDQLVAKALKLGFAASELHQTNHVLIEGTNSFVEAPEFDVERMRTIFRALGEKNKLLELLDRVQREKGMQIFIGAESEFSSAGNMSVIASPYGSQGQVLGAVGVIGPTRMNYQRVVPLVNFTAQLLSRILDRE